MSKDPGVEARVRIIVGDMSIEATLADSDAAQDFRIPAAALAFHERPISTREVCSVAKSDCRTGQAYT